jgi:hypothetical protein
VSKRLDLIASKFFGDELLFELAEFFGGEDRVLGARERLNALPEYGRVLGRPER